MSDARAQAKALRDLAEAADAAARAGAIEMGKVGKAAISRQLNQRSHWPGSPSPSPAGQPPARVSGELDDSLVATLPRRLGPGRWSVRVGPTAVYGRIHEFGGRTGRNHATTLPPRPYVRPGRDEAVRSGLARDAAVREFRIRVS